MNLIFKKLLQLRLGKKTTRPIKVLQVYALTGLGHLREATSIKNALDNAGIENDILDILKWAEMYNRYTRVAVLPLKVFKWFFEFSTRHTSTFNSFLLPNFALRGFLVLIRVFELPLGFALRRYLMASEYDVFLAVHPWGLGAIWSFGLGKAITQRLMNVIPDEIDISSASFYGIPGGEKGPMHLVNSQRVQALLERVGVYPSRIQVIGHTTDPNVYAHREKVFRRVQNKLKSNQPLTLGLYIGGTGTTDEKERIKKILVELKPFILQYIYNVKILPGPHLTFAEELNQLAEELGIKHLNNFEIYSSVNKHKVIEKGHEWFVKDIDVLFAKTGEIIFYSLCTGIPHIHFPPKGSNEVQHVDLMKTFNAIYEFDRISNLHEFLNDRKYLLQLSHNAYMSGYKLDGAYEIARLFGEVGQEII